MTRHKRNTHKYRKFGIGTCNGTFGELLQGVLAEEDVDFLVTFPIDCYTKAYFVVDRCELRIFPRYKTKALRLAKKILAHYELPVMGKIDIQSDIKVGKGLSSSTADMVAVSRAISSYYGLIIPNEMLEGFLREIEPSDGVMYDEIVSFYHREVKLDRKIGKISPLTVVGIDEGGSVNTIEFNKLKKPFNDEDKREYSRLLDMLKEAIERDDLRAVGNVSTKSAFMNQKLMPKKYFNNVLDICKEIDGLGVITAHSGTYLGILIDKNDRAYGSKVERSKYYLKQLNEKVLIFNSNFR